jgi:steroid delta-isomerase-like uncharacterized protein
MLILFFFVPLPASTDQVSENKAIISSFYQQVLNDKRLEKIEELFSDEAIDHIGQQIIKGRAKVKEGIGAFLRAFPDIQVTVNRMVGEGDFVVSHSTWTATHQGLFAGIAASGKQVALTGVDVFRLSNGKIIEHWGYADFVTLIQQIGAKIEAGTNNRLGVTTRRKIVLEIQCVTLSQNSRVGVGRSRRRGTCMSME